MLKLERLAGGAGLALSIIGAVFLVAMMLHICADVAGRVAFNQPLEATTEIVSAYYMVAAVFLPLAYVQGHGGHIFVEIFTRKLSPRRLALLDAGVGLTTLAYLAALIWASGSEALRRTIEGESWQTALGYLDIWPTRWFVPIGACVMAVLVVAKIGRDLRAGLR